MKPILSAISIHPNRIVLLSRFKERLTALLVIEDSEPSQDQVWGTSAAAAALLIEAASADDHLDPSELAQIEETLTSVLNVDSTEIEQTLKLAQQNLDHATCLHEITSIINSSWNLETKIDLIEALWKVVLTDQRIDPNEQHLMRKIKGLLHIPQSEYIAAKLRARQALNL